MANKLEKRLAALSNRDVELEEGKVEIRRLNTHMRDDLQKRLDHRRAEGFGTKTEQVNEAVAIYLAIFEDYGSLTPEQRRAIKSKLGD